MYSWFIITSMLLEVYLHSCAGCVNAWAQEVQVAAEEVVVEVKELHDVMFRFHRQSAGLHDLEGPELALLLVVMSLLRP